MSSFSVVFRPRSGVALLTQAQADERLDRSVRRRVGIAWGLLLFNTITFYPKTSFIPIPSIVGKGIAQAALPAALLVALTVNRRVMVRPNVFLCLVSCSSRGRSLRPCSPSISVPCTAPSGSPDSWPGCGC